MSKKLYIPQHISKSHLLAAIDALEHHMDEAEVAIKEHAVRGGTRIVNIKNACAGFTAGFCFALALQEKGLIIKQEPKP
jgi:hypothetical protein